MNTVYSVDVALCATAYKRARSAIEAVVITASLVNLSLEVPPFDALEGCIGVSDLKYDNPHLPNMSFSPAMTIAGPDPAKLPQAVDWHGAPWPTPGRFFLLVR